MVDHHPQPLGVIAVLVVERELVVLLEQREHPGFGPGGKRRTQFHGADRAARGEEEDQEGGSHPTEGQQSLVRTAGQRLSDLLREACPSI